MGIFETLGYLQNFCPTESPHKALGTNCMVKAAGPNKTQHTARPLKAQNVAALEQGLSCNPINAVNPLNPTNPINPLNTLSPLNPINPLNPLCPLNHLSPLNPLSPITPINPINPEGFAKFLDRPRPEKQAARLTHSSALTNPQKKTALPV